MHRIPPEPITAKAAIRKPGIALAGASGSHPALIKLLSQEISRLAPQLPVTVLDMSGFDKRGSATYADVSAQVLRPDPADAGICERLKTAAPNLVLSGGMLAFNRLVALFGRLLDDQAVNVLLLCHSWGFPEQALLRAARVRGIAVWQIDEGPFSLPLRGTRVPESSSTVDRAFLRMLRAIRLLPPRDMTGALLDKILVTAPGRQRTLVARGVEEKKVQVVPPPRFDRLAEVANRWRARPQEVQAKRILWLHQPFGSDGKVTRGAVDRAESMLINGIARCAGPAGPTLALRVHPRSGEAERKHLLGLVGRAGIPVVIDREPDLYASFMKTDVAVGFYSSALLEAAVCGMPAIAAAIPRDAFRQATEAAKAGAMSELGVDVGRNVEELAKLISRGLGDGPRDPPEALLDEEIGWLNGKGAVCVAELLIAAACAPRSIPQDKVTEAC